MSLSLEDTQKKLDVVAVFVLINEKGEFYQISQGDTIVIPLYLQADAAQGQLEKVLKTEKGLKGSIQPYSLNLFYKKTEALLKAAEKRGKKLATPIVIPEDEMAKATQILKSQGLSDEQIKAGLRVPVFFADPMITAKTPNGNRQVFFVGYSQLQKSIAALPADQRGKVKERVADLDVILNLIQESKDDKYAFMATEDYLKLREEYLKNQGKPSPNK